MGRSSQARRYIRENRPPDPPLRSARLGASRTARNQPCRNLDQPPNQRARRPETQSGRMTINRRKTLYTNRQSDEELTSIFISSTPVRTRHDKAKYAFDSRGRIYQEYHHRIWQLVRRRYRRNPRSIPRHFRKTWCFDWQRGPSPNDYRDNKEDLE
jgi:hypothetical protein